MTSHYDENWVCPCDMCNGRGEPEPYEEPYFEQCGIADAVKWGDSTLIIFGICQLPVGHEGRHMEARDNKLWADWSGGTERLSYDDFTHVNGNLYEPNGKV